MSQNLAFTKATKEQAKLRLAMFGPSGSGKTYTSLRIASGLSDKIAVIDTERGSASKYADRFEFDVLDLDEKDIDTYCQAITAAQSAGYAVLILDSLTHAWQELLSEVDKLARAKYGGNTWGAWSEGTPKQRKLVDAILSYDGHVIATMRSKTEWVTSTDSRGRTKPQRIGLAPQQGKGIEYEFDLLMELCTDHIGSILKDRTGRFQDQTIKEPGEEFGQQLAAWLTEGEPPKLPEPFMMDTVMPSVSTWSTLHDAAVKQLGYNHAVHVKNTLKQVFNGDAGNLTLEAAWTALVEHQESKQADAVGAE